MKDIYAWTTTWSPQSEQSSQEKEGNHGQNLAYYRAVWKLKKEESFHEYVKSNSIDEGETAQILVPGTTAILSHDGVTKEMESFCERWMSGNIYRANEVGIMRMNSKMWEDLSLPFMSLNASVENHAKLRSFLDKHLGSGGNWNENDIFNHVSDYLDSFINNGIVNQFRIAEDIFAWTTTFLHKVMLNINLTYDEAKHFTEMQLLFHKAMFLPKTALKHHLISKKLQLPQIIHWRKQMIETYKEILAFQYDSLKSDDTFLHFVASGFLDTLMIAGSPSVPRAIHNALAVIYSSKSPKKSELEINNDNLPNFVWEILRFYPVVNAIPYYTCNQKKKWRLITKGHFTKVYSIRVCELQNFSKFP